MIRYAEALKEVLDRASNRAIRATETVPCERSAGRALAETVAAAWDIPEFDNSAMDGFAVRSKETAAAEESVRLEIAGTIPAGAKPPKDAEVKSGVAWEIMTGAPVPESFDAVVRVEDVIIEQKGDRQIVVIPSEVPAGTNIRLAGEDFRRGGAVVPEGTLLQPEHILALAAFGLGDLKVKRRPKVALLSTGLELVTPSGNGMPLEEGRIFNSTAPYLVSALSLAGAEARHYGTVEDSPAPFLKIMEKILGDEPDLVLTTGGVSMGKFDFVKGALGDLGAKEVFHRVCIRPGKPLLFAEWPKGPVLFGLPGNPISTAVGLRFFIDPYLRQLQGLSPERPFRVRLAASTRKPEGVRCFFKGRVDLSRASAEILKGQASFMVSPLLEANAWVVLPEEGSETFADEPVEAFPLHALVTGERLS